MISIVVISKDETALEYTLDSLINLSSERQDAEILVVDSSEGRLDHLKRGEVRWIPFKPIPGIRITIPHQRNVGIANARGDIIVFTDAGCEPQPGWLDWLIEPIVSKRERMVCGVAIGRHGRSIYDPLQTDASDSYIEECPTINLAIERSVFDEVGTFDERFDYGSDVDLSWRVRDAGIRIQRVPRAVVSHDWGTRTRQAKRSYVYGRARARLYKKHRNRWRTIAKNDPVAIAYPAFILGVPLALRFRAYPALLLVPLIRNRQSHPFLAVSDHLLYGVGVLRELVGR